MIDLINFGICFVTKSFTMTTRTPNNYFVDAKPGWGWFEMTPRWLSGNLTLELGITWIETSLAGSRRRARVRASVPQLDEALKWCAERRMGVKLVCVEAQPHPKFVEYCHELDAQLKLRSRWSNIAEVNLSYESYASHRLAFKDPLHAFEFKLRWL
ncbi:hypothetical protein MKK68_12405 [Methylobacterium sp. E-016]|uniref:hypothetical protein n=1 Tax=Methylobacterium sp. E-016 TaxID=2836556 RepID=UPI001FB8A4F8|nr:hypothetical protein [Methylobacterium sp. E-016]MCJ2076447.1 hypothetical protein [Methylobacterium sp. E-016]